MEWQVAGETGNNILVSRGTSFAKVPLSSNTSSDLTFLQIQSHSEGGKYVPMYMYVIIEMVSTPLMATESVQDICQKNIPLTGTNELTTAGR